MRTQLLPTREETPSDDSKCANRCRSTAARPWLAALGALALAAAALPLRADVYSNPTPITIPAGAPATTSGPASPYPSVITVSGNGGVILNMTVTLFGFTHTYPDDVDVLLVGPNGAKVILMSDCGLSGDVINVDLTFSDGAAAPLPDSGQIVSGTYLPTNYDTVDTFPAPAPAGPYGTMLAAFNNISPNGNWSLYVVDDAAIDVGSFSGGWSIDVNTSPPGSLIASGSANPSSVVQGNATLLTVAVTPGTMPPSMNIAVTANLSAIGGSISQAFFDDGTNGDATPGDNVFSFMATVAAATPPGPYSLPFTASDQTTTFNGTIALTVDPMPPVSDFPEVEPNDTKAQANPVNGIMSGQSIAGTTTGTSTTVPGIGSADNFLVKTALAPLGVYRHRLQLTTMGTAGHTGTIRGLTQSGTIGVGGMPNPGTDAVIQTSLTAMTGTLPPRTVQWYGFGKEEQIYYRVTGTTTTTSPYFATLSTAPVTIADVPANFQPGNITITTCNQGHTTDTDFWVYDGQLNAIPGYGDDDTPAGFCGAGSSLQSYLQRNYDPGTYYIAMSNYNFANDQPASATDNFVVGALLDFPDAAADSSSTTNLNVTFTISDSAGTSMQVPATKPGPFDIVWFRFTVGSVTTSETIVTADPPNGHRDSLQNTDNNAAPQGIGVPGTPDEGSVGHYGAPQVTFSGPLSPAPTPANVVVSCTGGVCPTVTGVSGTGPTYTLTLSGQIPVLQCTTITFPGTAPGVKLQYSSLPGGTNNDVFVNTQDLLATIIALNDGSANSATGLSRFDINRSGAVNTQDLLRLVQLLNGVNGATQVFNGASVAACP
ncbi:MAG TPA: choice-of-anchor X domain-containing protein [Phycisphaerae bacterium]